MIRPRGPRSNIMGKVKRLLRQQERRKRATAIIAILAERYPHAFAVYEARRRPLKIGIYDDIEGFDGRDLALALMIYKNSFGYLTQMRAGVDRIGLDGRPAGSVTEEEEQVAERLVKERLTRMRRGRKSAAA
jgi:ProP effector